jgi:hypothetical protein
MLSSLADDLQILRKTRGAKQTLLAILLFRDIASIDTMFYTMLAYLETQQFPIGTPVTLRGFVIRKIIHTTPCFLALLLLWFVALLVSETGITLPEIAVRDIRIKLLILAGLEVRITEIIAIQQKLLALKKVPAKTNRLHIVLQLRHHQTQMPPILTVTKRFGSHNHLMLVVYNGLGVKALNHAMRSRHFGGLIIGDITLHLFALTANLLLIVCQPLLEPLGMTA